MKDNRPDHIDELFKDGLDPQRPEPSEAVWKNIEEELDKDNRRLLIVKFRAAFSITAAFLVLLCGAELYFHSPTGSRKKNTTLHSDSSSQGTVVSPTVIKNNTNTLAELPVRKKLVGHTGFPSYPEPGQEDEPAGSAGAKRAVPAEDSRIDISLQAMASTAPPSAIAPVQRLLLAHPAGAKKTGSPVAPQRPRRWAVTAYYSDEFAGYNLTDKDSMASNGKEIDKKEKHVFSSSATVLVTYKLSGHWFIETGLGYSRAKSHANPTTSYAVNNNGEIKFQVNTLSGYGYLPASSSAPARVGDSIVTEHSTTTLHYLNAPFLLSYGLHFKRLSLMPGIGISLNFLTGAALETKLQGASYNQRDYTVKMYGLKRLNYGVLLKTELSYAIDPHWSLDLVASFKNALTPINLHTVVATYPYNLGVGAGIRYSF